MHKIGYLLQLHLSFSYPPYESVGSTYLIPEIEIASIKIFTVHKFIKMLLERVCK